MSASPLVTVAWCDFQARTTALARELGGDACYITGGRVRQHPRLLPLRYLRDGVRTWQALSRRDPSAVIVVTPPVFAPLTAWLWCLVHRRPLVVDCHTGTFHSRKWAWARPIHRFLLGRARVALLHTAEAESEVAQWGVRTLLLPDDVVDAPPLTPHPRSTRPVVVVAGSLDTNEPIGAVLDAARLIPNVEIRCTGDLKRVSPAMVSSAPPNVRFTGWLDYGQFLEELQRADVVAAFSDDPEIMNRAAFEAVGLGRPLVLSDLPKLRGRFGPAGLFTANTPADMARGLLEALDDREQLAARSRALREALVADHARALAALRGLLGQKAESSTRPSLAVRPQRVLLVSAHPYPSHPLLRRNVDHLLKQGVEVDLVCMRDQRDGAALPARAGLRIRRLPVRHRRGNALSYLKEYLSFFVMAFPVVTAWSLRRRPEVVQVDNLPDFLVFAAVVPRLLGSRVVLYIYDLFPEMTMTRLKAPAGHTLVRLARFLERSSARFAHQVITVSECFRALLANRGIDPKRVSVLYNSQPVPGGLLRVRPQNPVMITHASLVERYGIQVAIRALPQLVAKWPDITYEVLGDGEHLPVLQSLAAELGVGDRVHFRGFRPWQETMERIGRASVGIVPVIADGFGELILPMKLLEYAGVGIPIVCSRLPGIEEGFPPDAVAYFSEGDAGELAAQVDRLLASPQAADLQVARAKAALQRLSWETVSPGYLRTLAAT